MKVYRVDGTSQAISLARNCEITAAPKCDKSIHFDKVSHEEIGNNKSISYFNSTDKVIDGDVYDAENIEQVRPIFFRLYS